ncbi:unnamed protein product [Durusdinium trenchii]|uniref:Microbial-type PARG catalytic domain-containing protein n=2 Tax=Durusdinium trenchii TaxID=1381693 RepID=A0ABP0LPL8_9DINO
MAADQVLSIFQRCVVPRLESQELKGVLQSLQPQGLGDAEIDELIKPFKGSDGMVHVEDFVRWIYSTPTLPSVMSRPPLAIHDMGTAPRVERGFGWLRKANGKTDRERRREISALTRQVVEHQAYQLGSTVIRLSHVEEMLQGTCLLFPGSPGWSEIPFGGTQIFSTELLVEEGTVLEVAVQEAQRGAHTVAVNAASAYHAGGGFLTGGRHALEEAMCVQSSLYESLEKGIALAEAAQVKAPSWVRPAKRRDGQEWVAHLPDDGVLLSPKVEVFRQGTNEGYTFRDQVTLLSAVVSVAMPNRNEKMNDSPVDAHPEPEGYRQQLDRKWLAVLKAAACNPEVTSLVVPDAGCGVFYNSPDEVGASFGRALRDFRGRFRRVIIAFPGGKAGIAFAAAAEEAFA